MVLPQARQPQVPPPPRFVRSSLLLPHDPWALLLWLLSAAQKRELAVLNAELAAACQDCQQQQGSY